MTDLSSSREKSRIGNVLMCFSVYTNTKMIFNTKLGTEEITVVHGIRFLTMAWMIIMHSIMFSTEYVGKCTDTKIAELRLCTSANESFSICIINVVSFM